MLGVIHKQTDRQKHAQTDRHRQTDTDTDTDTDTQEDKQGRRQTTGTRARGDAQPAAIVRKGQRVRVHFHNRNDVICHA